MRSVGSTSLAVLAFPAPPSPGTSAPSPLLPTLDSLALDFSDEKRRVGRRRLGEVTIRCAILGSCQFRVTRCDKHPRGGTENVGVGETCASPKIF